MPDRSDRRNEYVSPLQKLRNYSAGIILAYVPEYRASLCTKGSKSKQMDRSQALDFTRTQEDF